MGAVIKSWSSKMTSFDFISHIQGMLMHKVVSHDLGQLYPCGFAGYNPLPGCCHSWHWVSVAFPGAQCKLSVDLPFWHLRPPQPGLHCPYHYQHFSQNHLTSLWKLSKFPHLPVFFWALQPVPNSSHYSVPKSLPHFWVSFQQHFTLLVPIYCISPFSCCW